MNTPSQQQQPLSLLALFQAAQLPTPPRAFTVGTNAQGTWAYQLDATETEIGITRVPVGHMFTSQYRIGLDREDLKQQLFVALEELRKPGISSTEVFILNSGSWQVLLEVVRTKQHGIEAHFFGVDSSGNRGLIIAALTQSLFQDLVAELT